MAHIFYNFDIDLTLFRAGSERFDSGRGDFSAPPSDLKNHTLEQQTANGLW